MYERSYFIRKINAFLNCNDIFHENIGMGKLESPILANASIVKQLWVLL